MDCAPTDATFVNDLERRLGEALSEVPVADRAGFVGSDLHALHAALARVRRGGLARGDTFLEWGSGLGGACAVAAHLGFDVHGIEIEAALVERARALADELDLVATFVEGSFLQADDLPALGVMDQTAAVGGRAWAELGLTPADVDVVFAYPWPGEEDGYDRVFGRVATPGTLLLTYHGQDRVLVQRHEGDAEELRSLGWMGSP